MTQMLILRTNLPDFKRQMDRVKLEVQRKSVRSATAAAAAVIRSVVKSQAAMPKSPTSRRPRTGRLASAVYAAYNRRRSTAGRVAFTVGVRSGSRQKRIGRDAFYWRFLEGGWIPRGPGQALRGGNRSKAVQRDRLRRSGATFVQYPFIAPAFASSRGRAVDAFEKRMEREVRKLNEIK